jgi:hypothetical protein
MFREVISLLVGFKIFFIMFLIRNKTASNQFDFLNIYRVCGYEGCIFRDKIGFDERMETYWKGNIKVLS